MFQMVKMYAFFSAILMVMLVGLVATKSSNSPAQAQAQFTPTPSAYGELLDTEIRGIDPATIEGYRTGAGLGMALPAELNGYPGPRHVLDLADELELTSGQQTQIQALFDDMLPQAIALGEQILNQEAGLELAFRERTIDEESLRDRLGSIESLKAELRFVHLRTHLVTLDILTPHQVQLYNGLRGYTTVPEAHGTHHGH
jgi:Spy/CpxP family protein refolding chaperone